MKFPKIRYGPEIRLIAGCQYSESHVFLQTFLNPARGKNSHAIAIHQDIGHPACKQSRVHQSSEVRLFFREWHTDATNNLREAWITPKGIESGIHPDKSHSKRSLLETFFK